MSGPKFSGRFDVECRNADGSLAWRDSFPNGTTDAGINDNLAVYLASGTQKTTWYLGLIDDSGFSALNVTDTMASHTGWTESTAYAESVRQTWTPGAVAGKSVTNSSSPTFTMNATVTIKGAFLVSSNTKGGTAGTLWATGAFSAEQSLVSGQTLHFSYTCTGTGS